MLVNKYLRKKLMPCFCTTFQFRWIGRKGTKSSPFAPETKFFPGLKEAGDVTLKVSVFYICVYKVFGGFCSIYRRNERLLADEILISTIGYTYLLSTYSGN